jgi:hypothetical protein
MYTVWLNLSYYKLHAEFLKDFDDLDEMVIQSCVNVLVFKNAIYYQNLIKGLKKSWLEFGPFYMRKSS